MGEMRRILLIDDNADFRGVLGTRLRKDGFSVELSASGDDGLKALAKHSFDLILLDMLMPERDGIETYQALRANPTTKQTHVILLTGMAVEGHWEALPYESDGACFVMGKPYDLGVLIARINELLTKAGGAA